MTVKKDITKTAQIHVAMSITQNILGFIWKNVPSKKELFITSCSQSLLEMIMDHFTHTTAAAFGNNPTSRAYLRDLTKIQSEFIMSIQHEKYGGTRFWHDEFSFISTLQKPLVKCAIIYQPFSTSTETSISLLENFIKHDKIESNFNFSIPTSIQPLLEKHLSKSDLAERSRMSNFIAEPIARMIDGCSKQYQQNMKDKSITPAKGASHLIKSIPNALLYISKNAIPKIPYALSNAALKMIALDQLGELYGYLKVKTYFTQFRESITKSSGLYENMGCNWIDFKSSLYQNISCGSIDFITKISEKTSYNMLTMAVLSTPNKAIGNLLFHADENHPKIANTLGIIAGGVYIKYEFFYPKSKTISFLDSIKKSNTTLSDEETCYAQWINHVLTANRGQLPSYPYQDYYEKQKHLLELEKCITTVHAQDEASTPPVFPYSYHNETAHAPLESVEGVQDPHHHDEM